MWRGLQELTRDLLCVLKSFARADALRRPSFVASASFDLPTTSPKALPTLTFSMILKALWPDPWWPRTPGCPTRPQCPTWKGVRSARSPSCGTPRQRASSHRLSDRTGSDWLSISCPRSETRWQRSWTRRRTNTLVRTTTRSRRIFSGSGALISWCWSWPYIDAVPMFAPTKKNYEIIILTLNRHLSCEMWYWFLFNLELIGFMSLFRFILNFYFLFSSLFSERALTDRPLYYPEVKANFAFSFDAW